MYRRRLGLARVHSGVSKIAKRNAAGDLFNGDEHTTLETGEPVSSSHRKASPPRAESESESESESEKRAAGSAAANFTNPRLVHTNIDTAEGVDARKTIGNPCAQKTVVTDGRKKLHQFNQGEVWVWKTGICIWKGVDGKMKTAGTARQLKIRWLFGIDEDRKFYDRRLLQKNSCGERWEGPMTQPRTQLSGVEEEGALYRNRESSFSRKISPKRSVPPRLLAWLDDIRARVSNSQQPKQQQVRIGNKTSKPGSGSKSSKQTADSAGRVLYMGHTPGEGLRPRGVEFGHLLWFARIP
ncbi:hypothetical protein NEOLEDRAFT_1173748 [Neolentinus lepideus HHB14362 ss-1]|uniref:Uncharacterized protein n=1 Tax=Neolentinus lepideus HHB14362 ss-1 TaxID=1314782 RepID=A0A165M901_9AGAM|nr:hypothetical protein NEOLEDRAFT_1173748 [Neolentinus lepideus HHB14362 ss-1]